MGRSDRDNFRGCVIGQCLGDALGFPIEGHDADSCRAFVESVARAWFENGAPAMHRWLGQYTDDSQLARELLLSLVERKGFAPEDFARRVAEIFRENRIVGRGLACDTAARALNDGVHWQEAGCPPPAAGNGTAMRAGPIGMFFHDQPEALVSAAHEQGWITHQDPRCSAGSIAIAGAVALALRGEVDDQARFLQTLSGWMAPYHGEFADLVMKLEEWVPMDPDEAVAVIAPAGRPEDFVESWPGISPYVVPSVLWSLYSFLKHPDSYWAAVSTSVSVGGDVDTTGAMTGAVSGAYLGLEALPSELARTVNDRGNWAFEDLMPLADDCFEICHGG